MTARWRELTNLDGGQCSRQGATDDATTNHRQEHRRCSDVDGGCSNSDSRGKSEGVVAAALVVAAAAVAAATAATTTMVIAAERARTPAMAAANAIVTAAATAGATAMSTATAKAALKWLLSSSDAKAAVAQRRWRWQWQRQRQHSHSGAQCSCIDGSCQHQRRLRQHIGSVGQLHPQPLVGRAAAAHVGCCVLWLCFVLWLVIEG